MSEFAIKKGTLVKGWSGAENKYCIGFYFSSEMGRHNVIDHFTGDMLAVNRIVEIPEELTKQLEELGK